MKNDADWVIDFEPSKRATLRNQTAEARWVLHDANLQPSRLLVTLADGRLAPVFDTRSNKKFDNTARRSAFRRLEAGDELALFQLEVEQQGGEYQLGWGPFRVGPLAPGDYTACVVWEAREAEYFDASTQRKRVLDGAFVGSVRSLPVPLRLPLP